MIDDIQQELKDTLVEPERYLKTGTHIGTKFKSGEMQKYIYKSRKDGLKVLNIQTLDERIRVAAQFIARFEANNFIVVARKLYAQTPAKEFAKAVGAKVITGRFVPGTFTNPQAKEFFEPGVVLVAETDTDFQAIKEATAVNIPVIGMVSTNNTLRNVDLALPVNNKGRKSLALVYWVLAREILKARGDIKSDSEFKAKIEDFEYKLKEKPNQDRRKGGFRRFDNRRSFGRRDYQKRPFTRRTDTDSKPVRKVEDKKDSKEEKPAKSEKPVKAEKTEKAVKADKPEKVEKKE